MGAIKKISKLASIAINNPQRLIGLTYGDDDAKKKHLKNTYGITQLPTVSILDVLPGLNETLNNIAFLEGSSMVTDFALLKGLARSMKDCEYLEIGSWRGESLSNVADVATHCTSVSLSEKEMREMGIGEGFIKVHGLFTKDYKNITSIGHNSMTFDFSCLNKKFDLVFVDGDHTYEGVRKDTENVYKLLKDDNSVIVWHDYTYGVETPRHEVMAAIMDGLPVEAHKYLYHVSNSMCAIYSKKKLKTTDIKFPTPPDKTFSISISAKEFKA